MCDRQVEGESLNGYSARVRPTRRRLLFAMGISACSVALLLALFGSLFDSVRGRPGPETEIERRLAVHIRTGETRPIPELTMNAPAIPSKPIEEIDPENRLVPRHEAVTVRPPAPAPVARSAEDWQATAEQMASASIDEQVRYEQARSSMWRQSYSVMFRPTSDLVVKEEVPLIAYLQFRPEIHVLGLGFTIGSCFIGIPLVGVPVEDRTPDISVFVCAKKS